ncbi:MAG: OprO/OprP family phosphate-selective porin [Myxococcota bacterium]|nr:OprO/OprP family phosphate-selective porin [Myxococcota bacterium]
MIRALLLAATALALWSPLVASAQDRADATAASPSFPSPHEEAAASITAVETSGDVEAGLSPDEGAYVRTHDRAWSVRLGLLLQFRYQLSTTPAPSDESEFIVRVVRPQLRGTVLVPWVRFLIQPELAGASARLLDMQIDIQPHEAIGLRVGQFPTPFSRTFTTPVPALLFPDFAQANDCFRADRDTGAMLYGAPFGGVLEYFVVAFDGNRINQGGNDDDRMMYMARIVASPLGAVSADETPQLGAHVPFRFSIGVDGYLGEATATDTTTDPITGAAITTRSLEESQTVGADFQVRWETLSVQAEIYRRCTRDSSRSMRSATT